MSLRNNAAGGGRTGAVAGGGAAAYGGATASNKKSRVMTGANFNLFRQPSYTNNNNNNDNSELDLTESRGSITSGVPVNSSYAFAFNNQQYFNSINYQQLYQRTTTPHSQQYQHPQQPSRSLSSESQEDSPPPTLPPPPTTTFGAGHLTSGTPYTPVHNPFAGASFSSSNNNNNNPNIGNSSNNRVRFSQRKTYTSRHEPYMQLDNNSPPCTSTNAAGTGFGGNGVGVGGKQREKSFSALSTNNGRGARHRDSEPNPFDVIFYNRQALVRSLAFLSFCDR